MQKNAVNSEKFQETAIVNSTNITSNAMINEEDLKIKAY